MIEQEYITPVLYVTFYRHEYARQSFDAIKKAKPKKLYFYSNAARIERKEEVDGNKIIRSYIDEIDWDCELHTYFRDEYVDMVESHEGAYGWVFKTEKQLIEVDEDCIASVAFFDYCEKMLNHYADEKRIWLISGDNFTPEFYTSKYDITFSRNGHLYGFGIWKDRWEKFPRRIDDWNKKKYLQIFKDYYPTKREASFRLETLDKYFKNTYPHHPIWDFLLFFEIVKNNGLTIIPKYNLVRNIGKLGDHNTLGIEYYFHKLTILEKEEYIVGEFPVEIKPDDFYDRNHFKNHWLKFEVSFSKRIIRKLNKIFRLLFSSN